jgi:hypothetical protein
MLRTEAASNNVNDYGVNKSIENLPVLRNALAAARVRGNDEIMLRRTRTYILFHPAERSPNKHYTL